MSFVYGTKQGILIRGEMVGAGWKGTGREVRCPKCWTSASSSNLLFEWWSAACVTLAWEKVAGYLIYPANGWETELSKTGVDDAEAVSPFGQKYYFLTLSTSHTNIHG